MESTNIYNLPEPLYRALKTERKKPVPGRYSVTSLIDSPLRRILSIRHHDEVVDEASDSMWALLGKAVHYVIEKGNEDTETKFEVPFEGATIVGVIDYHKDGKVLDWKITSAWSAIFSDDHKYENQIQLYGLLLQMMNLPVTSLSIYMILRDWNKRERMKNPDYPEIPFKEISYPVWERDRSESYLRERVSLLKEADKVACGSNLSEIPPTLFCTPEERWQKKTTYAVKKSKEGRAVRVVEDEDAAENICRMEIERTKAQHFVEKRPGEMVRCENYCSYNTWCPVYLKVKNNE
jgi:hypothetical protein